MGGGGGDEETAIGGRKVSKHDRLAVGGPWHWHWHHCEYPARSAEQVERDWSNLGRDPNGERSLDRLIR